MPYILANWHWYSDMLAKILVVQLTELYQRGSNGQYLQQK